jgi:dienelactone hydrolase
MRWEATGVTGRLFPALDADITLTAEGDQATAVTLTGVYRSPLGALGAGLVAARFDFVSRAGQIAARDPQPAVLVTGAEDDPAFLLQAQRLQSELRQRYDDPERVGLMSIPGMKHAFAAEPGIEPAPQTAEAELMDAAVTGWFSRYLR